MDRLAEVRRLQGVAFLAASLWCTLAFGQTQPVVELELEAPEGCPSRDAIVAGVGQLVRRLPPSSLRAEARIVQDDGRWIAELTFESGKRVFPGDSCAAVAQALVVILALAVDPNARTEAPAVPSDNAEATYPVGEPEPSSVELAVPITPRPQRTTRLHGPPPTPSPQGRPPGPAESGRHETDTPLRPGASLLLLAEVGKLPGASIGPSLAARITAHPWAAELSIGYLVPRWAGLEDQLDKGGDISWGGAQLGGCWLNGGATTLGACAAAEVGDLMGEGRGVDHPGTGHALWLAGALTALARVWAGSALSVEARLGVGLPLRRPVLGLDPYGRVYEPGRVFGRFLTGIAWD